MDLLQIIADFATALGILAFTVLAMFTILGGLLWVHTDNKFANQPLDIELGNVHNLKVGDME